MRHTALIAALLAIAPTLAHAQGDPAAGKTAFNKCAACHSIKPGENKIGPTMHGIIGRASHSIEGFNYSEPMKNYNVTWDRPTMDAYLVNPRATVPGTRMIFAGIKSEEERSNLIAYLETLK